METYTLPEATHLGPVTLLVKDLNLLRRFYEEVLGFEVTESSASQLTLASNGLTILHLKKETGLDFAPAKNAGLYHVAYLYESAGSLARTLLRVFQIAPNLLQGSADHLVSQAFYLTDPEGNGIELYLDRPREQWIYNGDQLQMGSEPIDIEQFLSEHTGEDGSEQVRVGHIHLKVGDTEKARQFYVDTLGFSIIINFESALFVSAGGYHHHIGLNTWHSHGAEPRKPALGLENFEIILPDAQSFSALSEHLSKIKHLAVDIADDVITISDPWNTKIVIRSAN